jgi:hypothetical protein
MTVITHARENFLAGNRLFVRIQNAVQDPGDPEVIFAANLDVTNVGSGTLALQTNAIAAIGPSARLLLQWSEGAVANTVPARCTLSVYLTLRPA